MTAIQTSGSWLRNLLKNAATAVLLTTGATGLGACFSPALGSRVPFLIFTLAVAVTAQIAGAISGLAVTALSAFLIYYPAPASDPHMTTVVAIFGAVGGALSLFGGRQKHAEQEHRRIRYNLETAENIANIGSWESDVAENVWWSPQTCTIFGMEPRENLRLTDFYERVYPEDRDAVREAVRRAIETNSTMKSNTGS